MKTGYFQIIFIFFLLSYVEMKIKKTFKKKKRIKESKLNIKKDRMAVPPIGMKNIGKNILSRKKKNKKVIYSKNVKDILEGMLSGYNSLLKKYHIHSKVVYDPMQKKWFRIKVKVPQITCTNYHSVLLNTKYIQRFYNKIQNINENNYKTAIKNILRKLEFLILEVGNNCENMLDYIQFFKDQAKELFFLKKKEYNNPYLLMQVQSSKNNFLYSIGKFRKMGKFLGSLIAWYRIYKPPQNMLNQNNNNVLITALKLLKEDKKKEKTKKDKSQKKKKQSQKKEKVKTQSSSSSDKNVKSAKKDQKKK